MTKKDLVVWPGSGLSRMMNLNRFGDIFEEFDKLWRNWDLDMKAFSDMQPKANFPKLNVAETDDSFEVEVALAGFDKEDLSLELKDNCLLIKADKQEEISEEDGKKYLMREISSRSFRRALNLPKKVLTDDIECTHKDGVVKCVLKKEPELPAPEDDIIKIDIQ